MKFPLKFWTPLFWFPTLVCWSSYLPPIPPSQKKNILSWIWNLGWFWVFSDDLVMFMSSRYEIRVCKLRSRTSNFLNHSENDQPFQFLNDESPTCNFLLKLPSEIRVWCSYSPIDNWRIYNEVENWVSWWHGLKVYLNAGDARLVIKQNGLAILLFGMATMIGLIADNFNCFD